LFKTARFKVHNPSRHKKAMLWYAMTSYHLTLKRVLETCLADKTLIENASTPDKKGRLRVNSFRLGHFVRESVPKGWALAPVRDYLILDATAMLMSHLSKKEKGKHESNPPTMPVLEGMTDEEYASAYDNFVHESDFPIKSQQVERIEASRAEGHTRVAERLERVYQSWATTRAAGELLRRLEGPLPRPIEFTHTEFARGAMLARRGNDYFLLIRLFSKNHRYWEQKELAPGFIDWRTRKSIEDKRYPGIILPLEFGRDYHECEYLEHGSPKSAKLIAKRNEQGELDFYVHVAFEFNPEKMETEAVLGIDRGAAKIGSATIVDKSGNTLTAKLELEGSAFAAEMERLRKKIAELQSTGHQRSRIFRLRGRKADALIGEYANRVVAEAVRNRAQVVIEKIDSVSMARFLTQSQFTKLKDALTYKAERMGLPAPVEVPAAYTSQTCARCGHRARENRVSQAEFRCVACGYEANADDNASEIIALRGLHQIQQGGKFQKFELFQHWLQSLSGRDGQRA
jgi:IS605 OrfB family transposase